MLDVIDKKLNQGDIVGFKLFEYVTHRGIPKREVLRSLVLYIEECPVGLKLVIEGEEDQVRIHLCSLDPSRRKKFFLEVKKEYKLIHKNGELTLPNKHIYYNSFFSDRRRE